MNTFQELKLDYEILRGVSAAGFEKPFPIQERAIGPLLAGSDVIGQAKTGTGKTAAFGLPLLQAVDPGIPRVQALVLSPTRELALQITSALRKLGAYTGSRIVTLYGGQSINPQIDALRRGVHAVVGTPGRIIDHLQRGTLNLGSVKFVVLDEADTMLDMGFIEDVEFILNTVPEKRQLSLFSATMPQEIIRLSQRYMRQPERILIDLDEPSVDQLDQYYTVLQPEERLPFLVKLLSTEKPSSTIIFNRTKSGAHRLARELTRMELRAVPLHGDLTQAQREHSMNLFRTGRVDILVATDVASRGIDIPQVDYVVNYGLPQDLLLYFHRVGRTARAGSSGKAFTLVSPDEVGDFGLIRRRTRAPIKPLKPDDEKWLSVPPSSGYGGQRGRGGFRTRGAPGGFRGRQRRWYR